jgi:RNA-directed DNA polymerase
MSSWTPHLFRSEGERQGYNQDYLAALIAEGTRLHGLGMPVVFTLGHLASICDVPHRFLHQIVRREFDPYRVFNIRKRSGGYRQITVPTEHLLRVQRWIHENILMRRRVHGASAAFGAGCDPRKNANSHAGAKWLVKLDITDFFEAVSERQVYRAFRAAGFVALMAFQLTRICTKTSDFPWKYRKRRWKNPNQSRHKLFATTGLGHLPQGAPTSPMLANLVCVEMDAELERCATEFGCTYTRYADDIVFSAANLDRARAHDLIRRASVILGGHGFNRNRHKTHVAPPGARRVVTGLLVDRARPRLTGEYKERILLHLYHARTKTIHGHCVRRGFRSLLGFRAHLDGLITYAEYIDAEFGAECRAQFNTLPWGDLANW